MPFQVKDVFTGKDLEEYNKLTEPQRTALQAEFESAASEHLKPVSVFLAAGERVLEMIVGSDIIPLVAKLVRKYYKELTNLGFPHEAALALCSSFASSLGALRAKSG